ncbi:MAG: Broad specificity phosphatase PhoE [Phycisphaerales bacterium]|nr:Broad specificity phosphatase PhoE [Phycisphaerales bacterium]
MMFFTFQRNRILAKIVPLCVVIFLTGASPCLAGLKIYFLRHAEGGHNVLSQWKDKPKGQWPAYVGNENMLTPKGEKQVSAVPGKLAPYHFDFIACSPTWRTRKTILSYLQEHGIKAEIWPELEEYAYFHEPDPTPAPNAGLFSNGPEVAIPETEAALFTLRDDDHRRIAPSKEKKQATADINAIRERTIQIIRDRFGGTEQSILLVGHGTNGGTLLKSLLHNQKLPYPANASIWMIEQQKDGSFQLMIMNDEAVPKTP